MADLQTRPVNNNNTIQKEQDKFGEGWAIPFVIILTPAINVVIAKITMMGMVIF
jgi:hypothetical protein